MWYNSSCPLRAHVPVCRFVRQRGALFVLDVPSVNDPSLDVDEDFELPSVGVDVILSLRSTRRFERIGRSAVRIFETSDAIRVALHSLNRIG